MSAAPRRPRPIVFDAYGTLFDPASLAGPLEDHVPGQGARLAAAWRLTQLRHTWLRSLMGRFVNFDTLTREALDQVLLEAGLVADDALAADLAARWRVLPAYPDVAPALDALVGHPIAILTNGRRATVEATVRHAGLKARIPTVLSVEMVRSYKPAPAVYALAAAHFRVARGEIAFVSGNGWDCAGAGAAGLRAIRVRRTAEPAEAIGPGPIATIDSLEALPSVVRDW